MRIPAGQILFAAIGLLLFHGASPAQDKVQKNQRREQAPEAVRLLASKPVVENGLEFVAVVSEDCKIPSEPDPNVFPTKTPQTIRGVEIQLLITNKTKGDLVVIMDGAAVLKVKRAEGTVVHNLVTKKNNTTWPPLILSAGMTYCSTMPARIVCYKERGTAIALIRTGPYDGAGGNVFGDIGTGVLTLSYQFTSFKGIATMRGIPVWSGEAETPDVKLKISLPPLPAS